MRLTGRNTGASPTLSSTGTYSFKIATNGIVTKGSTYGNITSGLNTGDMTNVYSGNLDDQSVNLDPVANFGSTVTFLGTAYDWLAVSGNGGFSFGSQNDNRIGNNNPNSPLTSGGTPCLYMVNNDANVQQIWYTVIGGTTLTYKVMGNVNYDFSGINYEYDIYFYNDGTVDVFVVQESTNWSDYSYAQGEVMWGVTDGTNWVDGLALESHSSSLGASTSGKTGLRISGPLRLGGTSAPGPWTPLVPTGSPAQLFAGSADFEMGVWDSGDSGNIPDISGNNHSMGLNDPTYSGNVNYYSFFNNSAQANDWNWPTDNTDYLAIMGWFAFPSFGDDVSLVSRNEGGAGWALRVGTNGSTINLVKYGIADQIYNLPSALTTNAWHFIGISQQFGSIELIIDGTAYSYTGSGTPFASSGGPVRLQYDPYNGGNQNNQMYMRDVKIVGNGTSVSGLDLLSIWDGQKANYGY